MSEKKTKLPLSMNELNIKEEKDIISPFMKLIETDPDQAMVYLQKPKGKYRCYGHLQTVGSYGFNDGLST